MYVIIFASTFIVILLLLRCYYSHSVTNDVYIFELCLTFFHTQYTYDCYKYTY